MISKFHLDTIKYLRFRSGTTGIRSSVVTMSMICEPEIPNLNPGQGAFILFLLAFLLLTCQNGTQILFDSKIRREEHFLLTMKLDF